MGTIVLSIVAAGCLVATGFWARSTLVHRRAWQRAVRAYGTDSDAAALARTAFRKELHATTMYGALVVAAVIGLAFHTRNSILALALVLVPGRALVRVRKGLPARGTSLDGALHDRTPRRSRC